MSDEYVTITVMVKSFDVPKGTNPNLVKKMVEELPHTGTIVSHQVTCERSIEQVISEAVEASEEGLYRDEGNGWIPYVDIASVLPALEDDLGMSDEQEGIELAEKVKEQCHMQIILQAASDSEMGSGVY